ncbi:hypothetical protein EJB05_47117, partial [Eragrostis curvula]
MPPPTWSMRDVQGRDLPPDLLSEIHCRLDFVNRLNFALGLGSVASRRILNAEGPCLVLPSDDTDETATLFSLAGRQVAIAHAPDPAMRRHVVVGSSGGWLVTADLRGRLRMANPVTGEQAVLPEITKGTIPFFDRYDFVLDMNAFSNIRFGGCRPDKEFWGGTFTHAGWQMRKWFYRKVVLSASPRPGNYAAMVILEQRFGAPAFATSQDPAWRLAPSRDGVEDAIHHDGRFYSITYTGVVEAWDRHPRTGQYRSRALGPRLPGDGFQLFRKYVAASPDGRLMAVIKELKKVDKGYYNSWDEKWEPAFKVMVLDEARGRWAEEQDIGDTALFVGVNNSMCVSTKKYSGIKAGSVYYADDELGQASLRLEKGEYGSVSSRSSIDGDRLPDYNLRDLGVYSLQDGTVKRVWGLPKHKCWPPPAWFTPSV